MKPIKGEKMILDERIEAADLEVPRTIVWPYAVADLFSVPEPSTRKSSVGECPPRVGLFCYAVELTKSHKLADVESAVSLLEGRQLLTTMG